MPAKKTAAKKTTTRRQAPAKKKTAAKKTAAKKTTNRTKTAAPMTDDLAYENLWEDELTNQYPAMRKNNFLSLIVLGLGTLLVVVGIYIQISKENPPTTIPSQKSGDNASVNGSANNTGDTETGDVVSQDITASGLIDLPPRTTAATFPVDSQRMVETFYSYFNNDQFDQISALYDNNFNTVPGLVRYFSPSRLESRKENIIGDMNISEVNAVIDHPIVQRNSNAMVVQYRTNYTLKQDGQNYSETWYAYVVRGNGTFLLNGFECQENCAASPFFQLR